jgi:hypothetical protein
VLARVALKEPFVELAADPRTDDVGRAADLAARLGPLGQERGDPAFVEVEAVERVDGRLVDRNGEQPPVDVGQDPVLVGPPGGERAQVFDHVRGVRVKDVRAVLMVLQAGRIVRVVAVPGQVRPAVDQEHAGADLTGKPFGDRAPGQARPHDQHVVRGHEALEPWRSRRVAPSGESRSPRQP